VPQRKLATAAATIALIVALSGCAQAKPVIGHADDAAPLLKQAARALGLAEDEVKPVLGTTDEAALKRMLDAIARYKDQDVIETCGDVREAIGRVEGITQQDISDMLHEAAIADQYAEAAQLRDSITAYYVHGADIGDIYDAADGFTMVVCVDFG